MDSALIQDEYSDFTLKEEAQSCWITVNDVSVYVRRQDGCVCVDFYPLGMEMEDSICSMATPIRVATEKRREYEHELEAGDDGRRAIADWPGLRLEAGSDGDAEATERGD